MRARGRAWVFGDDINTDYIISAARKQSVRDLSEAARYLMEDVRPGFGSLVRPGDLIVAGQNFGCGSSREAAPVVIKLAGVAGVVAASFARIFYRNAINVGLPLLEAAPEGIADGDEVEVDFAAGTVRNLTRGGVIHGRPLPAFMRRILMAGGLVEYFTRHGQYPDPMVEGEETP
ncbi:3-isopropylmalate dehydratase small subunit [Thermaerobacter sp. FW80]|uniref:3-isopropylmalate dehydratase small subunit n=1 Tax=Thermaerobacter sp. FW80 TaxID=2546351 RepID=UPI0010752299|nr:3-isopropylmalate dehydratase small subunit [Thermaerobacter sp. FW80]QBS36687.1 3-isopropylmalate dehydratase small subunit [Thermaerobacter sp. FW80]